MGTNINMGINYTLVTPYSDPNRLLRVQFKGRYRERKRNGCSSRDRRRQLIWNEIHTVLVTISIIDRGNGTDINNIRVINEDN